MFVEFSKQCDKFQGEEYSLEIIVLGYFRRLSVVLVVFWEYEVIKIGEIGIRVCFFKSYKYFGWGLFRILGLLE